MWSAPELTLQVSHGNVSKTRALLSSCQQQCGELQPAAALQLVTGVCSVQHHAEARHATSVGHVPAISIPSFAPSVLLSFFLALSCTCCPLRLGLSFMHLGVCWSRGNTDRNALVMPVRWGKYYTHFHTFAEEVLEFRVFSWSLNICLFILANQDNLCTMKSSTKEVLKFCENPIKLWVKWSGAYYSLKRTPAKVILLNSLPAGVYNCL